MVKTNPLVVLPEVTKQRKELAPRDLVVPNQPCELIVRGRKYNLTDWADKHPGGPVIRQYHGLDATHVFEAFHGNGAHKQLQAFPSTKASDKDLVHFPAERSSEILVAFDKLKEDMTAAGLFKVSKPWCTYKVASTLALLPLGAYFHYLGYFWISALLLGVMWQQFGWIGHEFCHHQASKDRSWNRFMGLIFGNIVQGFSRTWWNDRHNSHHAATNILDADPDIDNIPVLAWAESDLDKAPAWCRKTLQYQAYYFLFALPVLRIAWCIESVKFSLRMKSSVYGYWKEQANNEIATLAIHYAWTLGFYLTLPTFGWMVTWFLVSQLLAGFGIAIVVFFNHYSCEKYPQALASNFVCLQLFTTRNMTPGPLTDWICGGLNYQIEHHLFPSLPRHNLTKASVLVKRFCAEQGLPYMCCGFMEGLGHVLSFLQGVADIAKQRFNTPHKA